jgi:cell division protein FtsB
LLGKGGWFKVWELDRQVLAHKKNDELKERNAKLSSEVDDLKQPRARSRNVRVSNWA